MTKTIESGFFKGEVPPHGSSVLKGEPTVAHGFSVEESELPTCEKCSDVSRERERSRREAADA